MAGNDYVQDKTCEVCKAGLEKEIANLCIRVGTLDLDFSKHKEADVDFKNEIKISVIKMQNKIIIGLLCLVGLLAVAVFTGVITGAIAVNIKVSFYESIKNFFC